MFRKILIANRGEIACRVIKTARRLGIASVAVYSDADANARHVALADEAVHIGPAPARESYLSIPAILEAARVTGAEAVHPGYGFLSENADFADACAKAGLVFIGPPASAIRAMGSKAEAKRLMEASGVPLVPGYHGAAQDRETLRAEAGKIGYPVLIKASAGGGGKGMRIVEHAGDFDAALEGAQREARASFGDDRVLIEKYLTKPRHIEVQVFADTLGNCVSLFERDCSIQRRHQKIIEEAPAPGLDSARRRAMGEAAVAAAKAVGYVGAGTVEFIAEGDGFFFMEMNTRLQVEHPVTEAITGLDLVEWQLRVADGEPLPRRADELFIDGHAIEVRVYAEDPARDFLPSVGRLSHLRAPEEGNGVRVDTGVRAGDAISPFYDPMIAKLIVHGEDRAAAVAKLRSALAQYEVVGVATNLDLLRAIATHPAFAAAELDTGFLARHAEVFEPATDADPHLPRVAAALARIAELRPRTEPSDPHSPWAIADAFRLNGEGHVDIALEEEGAAVTVRLTPRADGWCHIEIDGKQSSARLERDTLACDGHRLRVTIVRDGDRLVVIRDGRNYAFRVIDPHAPPGRDHGGDERVLAPIPARVTQVLVHAGDDVKKNAPLMVLEAMKMELTLRAPFDGVVEAVHHGVDEMVSEGAELVKLGRG